eukprot:CAMPEP_0171211504 /NCGR_PEP_ID=MMETSP0790-20130122/29656_1 /TAXON_ID=2925 /ORGANISM="Alexandrium catenella, Strain OF101" /LENGTH=147 /DNA_ID=CAMNT_0011677169 /DNA_START=61 /DNA_END=502 /DNA_ORIENTATION=-
MNAWAGGWQPPKLCPRPLRIAGLPQSLAQGLHSLQPRARSHRLLAELGHGLRGGTSALDADLHPAAAGAAPRHGALPHAIQPLQRTFEARGAALTLEARDLPRQHRGAAAPWAAEATALASGAAPGRAEPLAIPAPCSAPPTRGQER